MTEPDAPGTAEQAPPPDAVPAAEKRIKPAWIRLIVMLVLFVLVDGVIGSIDSAVSDNTVALFVVGLLVGPILAGLALLAYVKAVGFLERRTVSELARQDMVADVRLGLLLGFGLFSATIAIIALFGDYKIAGWGSLIAAVGSLGMMSASAIAEELLFRGVLFRLVEEMTGTWGAMAVSALVFGALHLVNSHATVPGALAIAIEGGLMLAAAYAATRTLWLPIALHLAWNFAEGGIFGVTVSGSGSGSTTGLFKGTLSGSTVLSGGTFGPEASIVAIVVCGIPTILFLRQARRRGRILPRS